MKSSAAGSPAARLPLDAADADWQQLAVFGAGLALGIALGAGVAILTAPSSGLETRHAIAKRARRARAATSERGRGAWDDLRREIRGVSRAIQRRKMRRELQAEMERGY